jgi:hypothetical protein
MCPSRIFFQLLGQAAFTLIGVVVPVVDLLFVFQVFAVVDSTQVLRIFFWFEIIVEISGARFPSINLDSWS